jgi:hypothetical protein
MARDKRHGKNKTRHRWSRQQMKMREIKDEHKNAFLKSIMPSTCRVEDRNL